MLGVQSLLNRNPDQPFSDRERRMMNGVPALRFLAFFLVLTAPVLRLLQERVNTMQAREELMREKMRELVRVRSSSATHFLIQQEHQQYREETERIAKQLETLRALLSDKS